MSSAPATPPTPSTRGQRAIIGAAIILFAVISAYLALVIITRVSALFFPAHPLTLPDAVGKVLPGVQTDGSVSQDPINILVMGLDRRPSEGQEPTRTDTLFVVHIDPKNHSTGILGFPRDMLVTIPGRAAQDRINTVYVEGELRGDPGGGVGLMKQVMENNFDIKIDKYVLIDFKGFEKIIDDLGGIDVDVPNEVYDPYYSETELPGDYLPQHFYPGVQHMDGVTALAYSRIRFSSDDLDRIQRQQRVIFATIDKAKSFDVLNPKKATSLWDEYKDTVKTDISDFQIADYALTANEVKDDIHAVSLGPAMVPYTEPTTGAQVLVGDKDLVKQIVDSVFSDAPATGLVITEATPEPVTVQVQNGSGVEGLGGRVLDYIASKGYPATDLVPPVNAWDGAPHATTEIIDLDGTHEKNGYLLANWLGLKDTAYRKATAAERAAIGSSAAVIVVLGNDVDFDTLIQSPTTSVPGG